MSELFQPSEIDLEKIITYDETLTFLVGAGISMEPPSCLVSARDIMDTIVHYGVTKDAIDDILSLNLRYEHIIEIFRDHYDPDLKIMEYFEEANEFNVIHRFLAKMIREGQYVMTTNFDYLIETAVGLNDPNLKIIITQTDFEEYSDIEQIKNKGILPVYKIHGCIKNPKTGEDTRNSIVTTIDSFGKHKEGEIFFVESFKKKLFEEICNGRTLIVMGYSGGDDFDIVPTLFHMKGIKRIIWISHSLNKDQIEEKYRLMDNMKFPIEERSGTENEDIILSRIRSELGSVDVYKIVTHTGNLVSSLMGENYEQFQKSLKTNPLQWLIDKFSNPSEESKCFFTGKIFYNYGLYSKAIQYYENFIKLTNTYENLKHL